MSDLAALLRMRNQTEEAEHWFRRAAEAGDSAAMYNLGVLLYERDLTEEAEHWFRRAIDAGLRAKPS